MGVTVVAVRVACGDRERGDVEVVVYVAAAVAVVAAAVDDYDVGCEGPEMDAYLILP